MAACLYSTYLKQSPQTLIPPTSPLHRGHPILTAIDLISAGYSLKIFTTLPFLAGKFLHSAVHVPHMTPVGHLGTKLCMVG